ncbi:MAG: flagellar basal body P-ring formation chaperone FlgA [Rhodospirillales bacterium]|nr:flagellar basal body P-ring formation chaperone FlgA [Rhodospirillales bacterium]
MTRILLLTLSILAFAAPAAVAAGVEQSVLRTAIVVEGPVIRLGDLFTNAGEKADAAVAYAPQPGRQVALDGQWLYRVAMANNLVWRPIDGRVRAVVERESNIVSRTDIIDALKPALVSHGAPEDIQVNIRSRTLEIHVATDKLPSISIEELHYDETSRRFMAIVAAPANDPEATRLRVSGTVHRVMEVPVLDRHLRAGDIISEEDLRWVELRADKVSRGLVTSADDLIGMAVTRQIRIGQPIIANQVQQPVLVPRRSLVTVVLQTPSMMMTVQGQAKEDGAEGETIAVMNLQSKKTIEGIVTGPGKVTIDQRPIHRIASR